MLNATSKQSYLGFHKAASLVPFGLIAFVMTSFTLLKKQLCTYFAGENTARMFEETIQKLIALLETESNTAIDSPKITK